MHIYQGQMYTPLQLTIDLWNTTTPNKFKILQNAHIARAGVPPPINNRSIEYHYIMQVSLHLISFTYSRMHIYQGPLLQLTIDLCNTTTPNKCKISQNAHICRAYIPPCNQPYIYRIQLHHRSFTYKIMHIYQGPLLQLTIHLWNTTTP